MAGCYQIVVILCLLPIIPVLGQLPSLGIPGGGDLVQCYSSTNNCIGPSRITNRTECCDNRGKESNTEFGFSVRTDGEGCRRCPIIFGFAETVFTAPERGQDYQVQAGFLSGRPDTGVVSAITLVEGSAERGLDFRLVTTQIRTFGSTPLSDISFTFINDAIGQENNETFQLRFNSIPSTAARQISEEPFAVRDTLSATIIDGDIITFDLSEADFRAVEGEDIADVKISKNQEFTLANPVTFRITPLTVEQALNRSIITSYPTPGDENVSPSRADTADFNTTVFEVIFPSDAGLGTSLADVDAPIRVKDDTKDEADNQFFIAYLELVNAINPNTINIERNTATIIIVDNDNIQIGYEIPAYTFFEPDFETFIQNVTIIKEDGQETEQTFAVVISINEPNVGIRPATQETEETTAAGINFDFRTAITSDMVDSFVFEFFPDQQSFTFNFFINSDELPEGTEGFRLGSAPERGQPEPPGFSFPTYQPPSGTNAHVNTEIIILDNDIAVVGFEQLSYTVNETDGFQEVCVQVFNPPSNEELVFSIFLQRQSITGSATNGSDFLQFLDIQVFPPSLPEPNVTRRECFFVFINDDDFYENTESFTILLELDPFLPQSGIRVDPPVTEIFIVDNDAVVIGFIDAPYVAFENDSFATVTFGVINGTLQREVAVNLSFADASAIDGGDFLLDAAGAYTLSASASRFSVQLPLNDDGVFELTETLTASLSFSSAEAPPRVTISPDSAQITILDDDILTFGFDPFEYEFGEDSGANSVSVSLLSGDLGEFTVVLIAATDDNNTEATATAGLDYDGVDAAQLVYSPSSSASASFDVTINSDDFTELREFFQTITTGFFVNRTDVPQLPLSSQESSRIRIIIPSARVYIIDADMARIGFQPVEYNISEAAGTVFFEFAVLEGNIAFDVNVLFFTSNGSALSASDYGAVSTEYSITGTGRVLAPVSIINDTQLEGRESFFGNLAPGLGASNFTSITFGPTLATANIIDNDDITIGFVPAVYNASEDDGSIVFTIEVIGGELSDGSQVEVEFYTEGGSASAGDDYEERVVPLTFTENELSLEVPVNIIDDDLLELSEVFFGNLRRPNGSVDSITFRPGRATATIVDNDAAIIGFVDDYQVTEGVDFSVTVPIRVLAGQLGRSVVVSVSTMDGSARAPGDYERHQQTLTFSPIQTEFNIMLAIRDDDVVEDSEVFQILAEFADNDTSRVTIAPDNSMIIIEDDDNVTIGFEVATYNVLESARAVNVTITLTGRTDRDLTVLLSTRNGTAISFGERDFIPIDSMLITFPASSLGQQSRVIPITIIDDIFVENDENFAALVSLSTVDSAILLQPAEAAITIIDDDAVEIGFEQPLYEVIENDASGMARIRVIIRQGVLRIPVVVEVNVNAGTATEGDDYMSVGPFQFTFDRNRVAYDIDIPLINDDVHEPTEQFSASLSTNEDADVVTLNPESTNIRILDDDEVTFSFRRRMIIVNEDVGSVTVFIDKNGTTVETLTLSVVGPFQVETNNVVDRMVTFGPDDNTTEITFNVADDNVALEMTEVLEWNLELVTMRERASVSPYNSTMIFIVDDDELVLELIKGGQVPESENATACISFSAPFAQSFSINAAPSLPANVTIPDAATPGEDYSSPPSALQADFSTYGPGNDLCFETPILDDDVTELEECFGVSISLGPEAEGLLVSISQNATSALCCIVDNDRVTIGFDRIEYNTDEPDGPVRITVSVQEGTLNRPAEVTFFTTDGTATSSVPTDYEQLGPLVLQFDEFTSTLDVSVQIFDDDILESLEFFFGNLNTSDDAVVLNPALTRVNIQEIGDEVTVGFDPGMYSVNEADGFATLFVRLLGGTLEREVTVLFETSPGTATETEPADYTRVTQVLTFSPSISANNVTVPISNDDILENAEVFFGNLNNQGQPVMTNPDLATVEITEDASDSVTIGFERIVYPGDEGDVLEVCVLLQSGTLEREAAVSVSSGGGSATAGSDYLPVSLPLTFSGSVSENCFNTTLLDDDVLESPENFILDLDTDDSSVTLAPEEAEVQISDTDRITVGLVELNFPVDEADGAFIEVCAAVMAGMLERDAIVTLQTADGTATSTGAVDYEAISVQFTFTPDSTVACANVSVQNDVIYEDPEDFTVSLSTQDPSVTIDPNRQTGTAIITDDDRITIGFVEDEYTVLEEDGSARVCVEVKNNGVLERSVVVNFATADGLPPRPASSDEDYASTTQSFTFTPANQAVDQCIDVSITNDDDVEGSENFLGELDSSEDRLTLDPQVTAVTILDNDQLRVGFIDEPYRGREGDGFIQVAVAVMGSLGAEIQVRLTTEDLTPNAQAMAGVDYLPLDQVLTFSPTISTVRVNVTVLNDDLVEGDEDLRARLEIITTGKDITLFPDDNAPLTILDDDRVVIGMVETAVEVSEDVGERELCASVMSGELAREAIVTVTYQSRNAMDGEDFLSRAVSLTFGPDTGVACFNTTILDDSRYELREDFFVNISTSDTQVDIMPSTTIVTILDDEMVVIGWESERYDVLESDGRVEVCAVLRDGTTLASPVPIINIRAEDGTAISAAIGELVQDYNSRPNPRFFNFRPEAPRRMCVNFTIVVDQVFEALEEDFFADLELTATERVTIAPMRTRIVIRDVDEITIGFDPDAYEVDEETGFRLVSVAVLDGSLNTDVVIRFNTSDGTAVSSGVNPDFLPEDVSLIFTPSRERIFINITIVNDQIAEPSEVFNAAISQVTPNDRVTLSPDMAEVLITDRNDVPVIGFERTHYMVPEDNSATTEICAIVMEPPSLARTATVTLTLMDGIATAPEDYIGRMVDLVFNASTSRLCIDFTGLEDVPVEGDENLTAVLTSPDGDVILSPESAVINITDGGMIFVMFERESYTFNEEDGTGTITIVKTGIVSESFDVRVTGGPSQQTDIERSAAGIDTVVTFGGGATPPGINISFPLTDDEVALEAVETYSVTFEILTSTELVRPGTIQQTEVNVRDPDVVRVRFGRPNVTVNESDGQFTMCVLKDRVTLRDVIVTISSRPGTASEGQDYNANAIPSSVTIPAADDRVCFTSESIIDDDESLEDDETVILNITDVRPDDPTTPIDPSNPRIVTTDGSTTVIIVDDDRVNIRFEEPMYTFREDAGVGMVCLIKDARTARPLTIDNISTSQVTATAIIDYGPGPYSVTFNTGAGDRQCIGIPIVLDTVPEPDGETFDVELNLPDPLEPRVLPGMPEMTRVTIIDSVDQREVNDTVIGDPLFTVPIRVEEEQLEALNVTQLSLCYEIHGRSGEWFNMVTDECASVNAQYVALSERLNVIDEIGVRAVRNDGSCVEIGVNVNQCIAQVDGMALDRYVGGGISVRRYGNRRVRISVPNCDEHTLVMWVICENRTLDNPDGEGTLSGSMIKFVVMRGLNFGHRTAHGLLGQFWNVPVDISPFTGSLRNGNPSQGRYNVSLTTFDNQRRSYTGWLYDLTWEFEERPCLYVGNRQAGPIYEVAQPNDGVIADLYSDYIVSSAFSEENYGFGLFNEGRCGAGSGTNVNVPN